MNLKAVIRFLKTSPLMVPVLALIDFMLWSVDRLAVWSAGPVRVQANTLVVLKFDVLGDYVVLRNYLRYLKGHPYYSEYMFTLCGNPAVKTLAETFDADLIDRFIWTDIYKLSTRPLYRFRFVRQLRQQGFAVAFCPTHSRVLVLDDFLALATAAPVRVGCAGDRINITNWEAAVGNRCYTRLLPSQPGIVFELERNQQTFSALLGQPVPVLPPVFPAHTIPPASSSGPYIVLSLGAGQPFRVWPASRFADLVRYLRNAHPDYRIMLTGAPGEEPFANDLLTQLDRLANVTDLTGKLTLLQLIGLLNEAALLVANETGTVHLAAALQTPTVVVSQGKSLVRWHPYPVTVNQSVRYVYPPELEAQRPNFAAIAERFNPESPLSIQDVTTQSVINEVRLLLRNDITV